jgi:hypothetical protein
MEEPVIVIALAVAVINSVGLWIISKKWFDENVSNILKVCLLIFDLLTIITLSKLI